MILDNIKYFILDEADRMLDMGFGPEIKKVVTNYTMPSKENRQTLMFSATFPEEVQQIASEYLNDYVFLTVGRVGSTTSDIEQHVMQLQEYDKREKLCEILNKSSKYMSFVKNPVVCHAYKVAGNIVAIALFTYVLIKSLQ